MESSRDFFCVITSANSIQYYYKQVPFLCASDIVESFDLGATDRPINTMKQLLLALFPLHLYSLLCFPFAAITTVRQF